jgi:hypothetical protein
MTKSRKHPTSPYLLRRLRSYEEARAERQRSPDDVISDAPRDPRSRDADADTQAE